MSKTRDNHYVPQWYQKGFLTNPDDNLYYLDLSPDNIRYPNGMPVTMPDGTPKTHKDLNHWPTSRCFFQKDLYTTFFGQYINDDIEKLLFGRIDDEGAKAVRAFIGTDMEGWHKHFTNFFSFIDAQKIRTPKGLDWITHQYPELNQMNLMEEMQSIRNIHCAIWAEGVREIVNANSSNTKFIISDHPVTIFNYACDLNSTYFEYPKDPSIQLKASQTLFPLNKDLCLILTNLEYAESPELSDPIRKRTHSKLQRKSYALTDKYIRTRSLSENQVTSINYILKKRAKRYIAAEKKEWLYPEKKIDLNWEEVKITLLPPKDELYKFGGEIIIGYKDGTTHYQDKFGRETPENKYLKKVVPKSIGKNSLCGCGSGLKFKNCCLEVPMEKRPAWDVLSIRERNIILYRGVYDIFGLNKGKTWDDIRREVSNEQIVKLYNLYWSLWPIETDLFQLLPKPDNQLRAVYTGILDPRTITIPLATTPLFDQVIIQHPFIHPKAVKPEFSPLENPHQHKYGTLKNLLFFLTLEPYVRSGQVNLVPDPCMFDRFLHNEMMNMAKARGNDLPIHETEKKRIEKLWEEDYFRTVFRSQTEAQIKNKISQSDKNLSNTKINQIFGYLKKINNNDQLSILQDDLLEDGGQFSINSMAPNFEMTLFIANITGSIALTDSETRWDELLRCQHKDLGTTSQLMSSLTKITNNNKYILSINPDNNLNEIVRSKFGEFRKLFREILFQAINTKKEPSPTLIDRYIADFDKSRQKTNKVFFTQKESLFETKLKLSIPKGGFTHKNVSRLLLKSGNTEFKRKVPMGIFIEPSKW